MTRAIRTILAASAALLLAGAPALATDDEIIALSEQSAQAFAEGRYDDADAAAEAAWRQAEIEWGAVEDTAFLADNLARQRLMLDQRAAAREPAARVLELAEAGLTPSIRSEEARLAVAIAAFDPASQDTIPLGALQSALQAAETGGVPPNPLVWSGWLDVGRAYFNNGAWYSARQAGEAAMRAIAALGDAPVNARAEVALITGISAAQLEEYEQAAVAFQWAVASIPPTIPNADGSTEANPSWATLQAWTAAMDAAYATVEQEAQTEGTALTDLPIPPAFGVAQNCRPVWVSRRGGTYPAGALPRLNTRLHSGDMLIGAVVIGYKIASDGSTEDVKVLAAVPDSVDAFSSSTRRTVESWRADPDSLDGCTGQAMMATTQFRVIYPR